MFKKEKHIIITDNEISNINGLQVVNELVYLSSLIFNGGYCRNAIKRIINMNRATVYKWHKIWKD